MRNKALLVVGLLASLLLFVYLTNNDSRHFKWDRYTDFRHNDDEPFGCQLFDSIAAATLPNGYTVAKGEIDDVLDTIGGGRSLLLMELADSIDIDFAHRLDSFVRSGNKLMIVDHWFKSKYVIWGAMHLFQVDIFEEQMLRGSILNHSDMATLQMRDEASGQIDVSYAVASSFISYMCDSFEVTSTIQVPETIDGADYFDGTAIGPVENYSHGDTVEYVVTDFVASDSVGNVLSAKCKVGKGEVHIVATPLLFTNYGALDKEISRYLSFQLSQISDYPVVRVEIPEYDYSESENKVSPLYYMLGQPPLRWALYVLLAAVLLFMFFTARRRQRIIPPDNRPVNRNLQFVEMLGLLYYQRHDNRDMLSKKYTYFKEELRRRLMLDFGNEDEDAANVLKLAQATGMAEEELAGVIRSLRMNTSPERDENLDDSELTYLIDKMNDILKNI